MLLPSLDKLIKENKIECKNVFGSSRKPLTAATILKETFGTNYKKTKISKKYVPVSLNTKSDILKFLKEYEITKTSKLIIFLSVPPSATSGMIELLASAGLNSKNVKLLLEKPFGTDFKSANTLLKHVDKYFKQENVYKVDHYLAKAGTSNLALFCQKYLPFYGFKVKSIKIVAYENIDIQGRSDFYEQTGALKDFIQNHLMEILLKVISKNEANRLLASKSLKLDTTKKQIRGQYIGYKKEANNPKSNVETYASIYLKSSLPKFKNTQINLVTGKALNEKVTKVNIITDLCEIEFTITPFSELPVIIKEKDKKIIPNFFVNDKSLDGYANVFYSAYVDDKSKFALSSEILNSWKIIDQIKNKWKVNKDLVTYKKNSDPNKIVK